jgi:hypothetical protein
VSGSGSVSSIQFLLCVSFQFSCRSRSSVHTPRSPRQNFEVRTSSVLPAIFFLVPVAISSARFLCFQLGPKRAVPRAPSVSPRFCPLKLFARPYLATAGLLCLYCFISSFVSQRIHVPRFDSDFRPRLLGLRAKGQSSHWIVAAGGLVPAVACSSQILLWLQTSVGCS